MPKSAAHVLFVLTNAILHSLLSFFLLLTLHPPPKKKTPKVTKCDLTTWPPYSSLASVHFLEYRTKCFWDLMNQVCDSKLKPSFWLSPVFVKIYKYLSTNFKYIYSYQSHFSADFYHHFLINILSLRQIIWGYELRQPTAENRSFVRLLSNDALMVENNIVIV